VAFCFAYVERTLLSVAFDFDFDFFDFDFFDFDFLALIYLTFDLIRSAPIVSSFALL
jgi:hypothetical protein